jgi:hypothetical protein
MQSSQLRRRLSESSVDELAAEKACEHWGEGKDDCVVDVLTTGDLEMAMVGTYSGRGGLRGVEATAACFLVPWMFAGGLFMFYII